MLQQLVHCRNISPWERETGSHDTTTATHRAELQERICLESTAMSAVLTFSQKALQHCKKTEHVYFVYFMFDTWHLCYEVTHDHVC